MTCGCKERCQVGSQIYEPELGLGIWVRDINLVVVSLGNEYYPLAKEDRERRRGPHTRPGTPTLRQWREEEEPAKGGRGGNQKEKKKQKRMATSEAREQCFKREVVRWRRGREKGCP